MKIKLVRDVDGLFGREIGAGGGGAHQHFPKENGFDKHRAQDDGRKTRFVSPSNLHNPAAVYFQTATGARKS